MNKRGEVNKVGLIIIAAISIIVCAVFLQQIAANQSKATTKELQYNETNIPSNCWVNTSGSVSFQVNTSRSACNITVARNTTGEWQYSGCPITGVVMRNSTNATATLGTDYIVFNSTGIVALQNTTFWQNNTNGGNLTFTDYTFCPIGYNTDSGSRGVANLWVILSIIALFVTVSIRKDWFDDLF